MAALSIAAVTGLIPPAIALTLALAITGPRRRPAREPRRIQSQSRSVLDGGLMGGKGINYDTGSCQETTPDPTLTRPSSRQRSVSSHASSAAQRSASPARTLGGSSVAARAAAAGTGGVVLAVPGRAPAADLIGLFRDCAGRAERLRREGAAVVLAIGCELTLFNPGYLPGTFFYDRTRRLARPGPRQLVAFARLPKRLNGFLARLRGRPRPVRRTAHLRLRDLGAG